MTDPMSAIEDILGMPADPTDDLPTAPGYFLSGGVGKEREWVLQLAPSIVTGNLEWWAVSNRNGPQGTTTRLTDEEAARHLPLTRLEPAADTAKSAADWFWDKRADLINIREGDDIRALLSEFEANFGLVTS